MPKTINNVSRETIYMNNNSQTGKTGEDLACDYLKRKSYKILERNHRQKWGELDIITIAPDKTLVFSHVPRKFNNPEESVDMAEFWETQQQFRLGEQVCEIGSIFPGPAGYGLAKQGAPIKLKRENRGNEILSLIYTELGITKNITGHFHESAGRANDSEGCAVQEGLFVPTLFYNAACMDRLMVGMVSVDGVKVAYENVNLQKYLK